MKKKKILPISTKIPVYTYSYYGYPHSIIASEEHIGNDVAKMEIIDYRNYEWFEQFENFSIKRNEDFFRVQTPHPYGEEQHGVTSRKLELTDAIRVRIHYQQYAHPWGAVNLFIADMDKEKLPLGDDEYLFRLGYFNREGVYFRNHNITKSLPYNCRSFPIDLMLCRDHDVVEAYLFDGENKYLLIQEKMKQEEQRELKIGVQIRGNENTYYNWLYRNFIQISCDMDDEDRPIDYFYGVEKNWRFDWHNFFLNTDKIPIQLINRYGVLRFLKECIDEGKYIELNLDQYHVVGRREFHYAHHLHQNLIFGYDDEQKVFHLLGYTDHGNMTKTEISYADIKYQFQKKKCVSEIYVIEYEQDAYGITYHEAYIIEMIRQYLKGENSSESIAHLLEPKNRVYGMKCYEELLSERGMKRILSDRRILHLLYEHKYLMKQRLGYLDFHGNINGCKELTGEYDEVVRTAFNIRNLAVKYMLKEEMGIADKIKSGLENMRVKEENILTQMIGD